MSILTLVVSERRYFRFGVKVAIVIALSIPVNVVVMADDTFLDEPVFVREDCQCSGLGIELERSYAGVDEDTFIAGIPVDRDVRLECEYGDVSERAKNAMLGLHYVSAETAAAVFQYHVDAFRASVSNIIADNPSELIKEEDEAGRKYAYYQVYTCSSGEAEICYAAYGVLLHRENYFIWISVTGTDAGGFNNEGEFINTFHVLENHAMKTADLKGLVISPRDVELDAGEEIVFSLYTLDGKKVDEDEILWIVLNQTHEQSSIVQRLTQHMGKTEDEIRAELPIGRFYEPAVFAALNPGKCQVGVQLKQHKGKTVEKVEVNVRCPRHDAANAFDNIAKIREMFDQDSRFVGPYHIADVGYWRGFLRCIGELKASCYVLGEDLGLWGISTEDKFQNPLAGVTNNLVKDLRGGANWSKHDCGGCQEAVLIWLEKMRLSGQHCALFEGIEFGPIYGSAGGHNAVVIFPEGTNWKNSGYVFDPWPFQRPVVFLIDTWKTRFPKFGGSLMSWHRVEYPCVMDDANDYANATPGWKKDYKFYGVTRCPLNLLLTDVQGRRSGTLGDGSMVFEIPNAFVVNLPDDVHGNNWYFELDAKVSPSYALELTGTDQGAFDFFWGAIPGSTVQFWGAKPISSGATARIILDPANPKAPLTLPDGTNAEPMIFKFRTPTLSAPCIPLLLLAQ